MKKTILVTGATDGIGLQAAQKLSALGHTLLIHGRNFEKLRQVANSLLAENESIFIYQADFSDLQQVKKMANEIKQSHPKIDVVINNAGVLKSSTEINVGEIDIRFRVNTIAPFILTQFLLENLANLARVVNLASAAQAGFDLKFLEGKVYSDAMKAYAESKLALIVWTFAMATTAQNNTQFIAINPGSLLATKMVKEGFGIVGKDISIGADILVETALDDKFANANGRYFDNDIAKFSQPDAIALDSKLQQALLQALERFL